MKKYHLTFDFDDFCVGIFFFKDAPKFESDPQYILSYFFQNIK